jgi:uncharacterized protein (DUF952 family)
VQLTALHRFMLDQCHTARHLTSMMIYKIFRCNEWATFQQAGETLGAPVDLADGFIHFSTASQAAETAVRHFADVDGLMLLAVDADGLGDVLKWEASRGGDLFPHLYGKLKMADVVWAKPLPITAGKHQFPKETE